MGEHRPITTLLTCRGFSLVSIVHDENNTLNSTAVLSGTRHGWFRSHVLWIQRIGIGRLSDPEATLMCDDLGFIMMPDYESQWNPGLHGDLKWITIGI